MASRLEYKKEVASRSKDHTDRQVVLIISPDTPRGSWPLARAQEVYPGEDDHVLDVKVLVGQGRMIHVRPISKLCPLEREM